MIFFNSLGREWVSQCFWHVLGSVMTLNFTNLPPKKRTKTKNQTNQTKTKTWGREHARVFLKNSNKSYSKTPRNPSWVFMAFYLLQLKVKESAFSSPHSPSPAPPLPWESQVEGNMDVCYENYIRCLPAFPFFIMNSLT